MSIHHLTTHALGTQASSPAPRDPSRSGPPGLLDLLLPTPSATTATSTSKPEPKATTSAPATTPQPTATTVPGVARPAQTSKASKASTSSTAPPAPTTPAIAEPGPTITETVTVVVPVAAAAEDGEHPAMVLGLILVWLVAIVRLSYVYRGVRRRRREEEVLQRYAASAIHRARTGQPHLMLVD